MPNLSSHRIIICAGVVDTYLPGGSDGAVHTYNAGERLEGLPPEWVPLMHELGVGMMQIDLPHVTTPEIAEGTWDWSKIDLWIEQCRQQGFQVMLFPHWHWPPNWYIQKYGLEGIRCLEHDERLPCFSIWDPSALPWYERCIGALADHYNTVGAAPDGIFLGIHGDYGECMFPVSSTEQLSDRFQFERGESIAHCHSGFWCGDRHAREHFPKYLLEKYGSLDHLNVVWATRSDRIEEVSFPNRGQCNRRAWLDFVGWYMDAMTQFAGSVANIYRRYFPNAVLTLPLGGGVEPVEFGQDNTALAKAMQSSNTAVRSTANTCLHLSRDFGRVEKFSRGYAILKRIKAACQHYGLPMWLEPPYPPSRDAVAVTAGIFEALSCGVSGCLDWGRTFHRQQDRYRKLKGILRGADPVVDTAVYFPTSSHRLTSKSEKYKGNLPARFWDGCAALRPYSDYNVLDERLIQDGAMGAYRWLIVFEADLVEKETIEIIRRWINEGGIAVIAANGNMQTVEGDTEPVNRLLGITDHARVTGCMEGITLASHPALTYLNIQDLSEMQSGWQDTDTAVTPLIMRGATVIAWQRTLGSGRIFALSEGASQLSVMLELFRGICGTNKHLPSALDVCHSPQEAMAVFVTHFNDGIAVLNLNEHPIEIKIGSLPTTIPALDLTWIASNQP